MLSILTTISIFTEIFAAGILISGAVTFFKNFIVARKLKDLFFCLFFVSFYSYVGASLTSQLMFNLGRSLADLILVQKGVSISLAACAFFLWLFIVEKFEVKWLRQFAFLGLLLIIYVIFQIAISSVILVYREGIIEPIVNFSGWAPVQLIFAVSWLLMAMLSFGAAFFAFGGKRILLIWTGFSAILLLGATFSSSQYLRTGEAGYLLTSWLINLLAIMGLLLAEVIPQESPEAKSPLRFLRTRVLFKLMLVFVLLIVILFEATTLATINISKKALSKTIQSEYLREAENIAEKISLIPDSSKIEIVQNLVQKPINEGKATAFVVDEQGKLLAHPDQKRAIEREDLSANEAVQNLKNGDWGVAEFRDELRSEMVGAFVPIRRFGWGVVVQEPITLAYFEMRRLETNSLLFVIAGIILTALTGIFFANSLERPIKELTKGTEAVARGDLGYRISIGSIDEIGRLALAYNQMTKDLRDSQERLILSEKLASLGTMAAGMAHEIKNPLVSLRTFTQLLQQKWDDKEFREKFSSIIPHEIERINRIAESLLKFGRPMKPELSKVEVNNLLDEVLLLFESECKKYNVRVTKILAELPEISGDAGQLSQAFVNIIKNAIEAMHEKGGELIVKTDIGEVVKLGKGQSRQGAKKRDEMVWGDEEEMETPTPVIFIEVSDTGEGISEGSLKSLFDPFFTTKMTGTGMGLPITLRIIEEHKGSIKVRSRLGKGTTFIITLPQAC